MIIVLSVEDRYFLKNKLKELVNNVVHKKLNLIFSISLCKRNLIYFVINVFKVEKRKLR